jgi:multisubunit Na+/H+ antiporter MnhB subunit
MQRDDGHVDALADVVPFAVAVCICALGFRYLQRRDAERGIGRRGTRRQAMKRGLVVVGLLILAPTLSYSVASLVSMSQSHADALAALIELCLLAGIFGWRAARSSRPS